MTETQTAAHGQDSGNPLEQLLKDTARDNPKLYEFFAEVFFPEPTDADPDEAIASFLSALDDEQYRKDVKCLAAKVKERPRSSGGDA